MTSKSVIKGKREELRLNKHKITVISPGKLIDYEEGREKLKKLLEENR